MKFARSSKSVLLRTCGTAALALGVLALPTTANAQAFQATPSVVQGTVTIDRAVPNVDTITVDGLDAVIDWTPDEISGSALTFLPNGNTAIFQSLPGATDFAVINRVLPSTNGDVTVMNGAVISQLQQLAGPPVPGGNVMFYSSTGLIIGATATFDVGGLVLTSLAPDINTFDQFVSSTGSTSFTGVANDASFVQIDPGASISATEEGSYFAVISPQVLMSGTANINGSTAYVGAQEATLAYADGLFDIIITTGSNAATPLFHDGTTTGPASTGGTDNHVIYGVTAAQANPIAALFQGDLGYAPAVSATIDNGEIVLTANYNVSGRDVGFNTFGDTTFEGVGALSQIDASISIVDANFASDSLIISSGTANVSAQAANSTIDGDITIYSQNNTGVIASGGNNLLVTGDLVAAGYKRGELAATSAIPGQIDGIGTNAVVQAQSGSTITIQGDARVDASGLGGFATSENLSGSAFGGFALLSADGGAVDVVGDVLVAAIGSAFNLPTASSGGETGGGLALIEAANGGLMNIDGGLNASASAFSPNLPDQTVTTPIVGNAFAGQAFVQTTFGSTTTIGGNIQLSSTAGGASTANTSATGGSATGNFAAISVNTGGDFTANGNVLISVGATAGDGHNGGTALAGNGGINVEDFGTATVTGSFTVQGTANGGNATAGFGGTGGDARGRLVFVASTGSDTQVSTINLGDVILQSGATGGIGGAADGDAIAAGAGGTGMAGTFDTGNLVGGAYVQAGRNNAVLNVGNIQLSANGAGGLGGAGSATQVGGDGGVGMGGTVFIGINDLIGSALTTNPSSVTFGNAIASADGFGAQGGSGVPGQGVGGDGLGGDARLVALIGNVIGGSVEMIARGVGGNGSVGGLGGNFAGFVSGGFDGGVSIEVNNGASLTVQDFSGFARGLGGNGDAAGGAGVGGSAKSSIDGSLTVNDFLTFDTLAFGGNGEVGGDAYGGAAELILDFGTVDVTNGVNVFADALAGDASIGFGGDGGYAQGGRALILAAGDLVTDAAITIGGNVNIRSTASAGNGGDGDGVSIAPGAGGRADGGEAAADVFAFPGLTGGAFAFAFGDRGMLDIGGNLSMNASASAGDGGMAGVGQLGGAGGNADSGDALAVVIPGTGDGSVALGSLSAGTTVINSQAFAGNGGFDSSGTVLTGLGGNATAGRSIVQAQFGTVTLGATTLATNAFGGDGSVGGTAIGGLRSGVSILNSDSGTIFLDSLLAIANAEGGQGTNGNGGDATGGAAFVGFQGGAITIFGTTTVSADGFGGSAINGNGGTGTGGLSDLADFLGTPGSGDFQGASQVIASGVGGAALSAGFDGGAGIGGTAFIDSQPGSILNAADIDIVAFGRGGAAIDGIGGLGQGGLATATSGGAGAQLFAGSIEMNAGSIGGTSPDGVGGDAVGGLASATAEDSGEFVVDTQLVVNTVSTAGDGASGGDSFGGESAAIARDNGTLTVGDLDINANADTAGTNGGDVEGGIAELLVTGPASITANSAVLSGQASGASGGSATGGSATVAIETSGLTGTGQLDVGTIVFEVDGLGTGTVTAGDFDIFALNGNASFQTLSGTATGSSANDSISLEANGFDITITNSATIDAVNDLEFITANGGMILGGTDANNLTASFDFATCDFCVISILGDNDNLPSFGALNMQLTSGDIDVPLGARFGAVNLDFISNNTNHAAVIGGATNGLGYTMTQEEAARIEATNVGFDGAQTTGGDPYDVEIRDLVIFGSLDDGVSTVNIGSNGTLGVVGAVDFQFAGPDDLLQLGANTRIDILIEDGGSLFVTNSGGDLAGRIGLSSPSIFAVDNDTLSQLLVDPEFSGLPDVLATEPGFEEPQAYIAANSVDISVDDYIYTQNWGAGGIMSGIAVGSGELTLVQSSDAISNLLNAIVYGIQVNGVDDFTTNADFFSIVTFNMTPANHFTTASTVNDCFIVSGACGVAGSSETEEVVETVTTSTYTEPPPVVTAQIAEVIEQSEADTEFGVDFPGLFNPPAVQDQGVIREPVTSGGDAANYADNSDDSEEDNQDGI